MEKTNDNDNDDNEFSKLPQDVQLFVDNVINQSKELAPKSDFILPTTKISTLEV